MKRLAIVALSALMSVNAFALFSETEPNDTRASADVVLYGNIAPWSDVGVLSLTANDSDFFKIRLNAGDWLTAITFPTGTNYFSPDTVMALFDASSNTAIVWNDDAAGGGNESGANADAHRGQNRAASQLGLEDAGADAHAQLRRITQTHRAGVGGEPRAGGDR